MSLENLTLGTELRNARKSAGLSIAQIAEITRIRAGIISDLESDNFESCGGHAYARLNIRAIAKAINLDSDVLITKFEDVTGEFDRPMIDLLTENNVTIAKPERKKISSKTLASVAAGVIALMVAVPTIGGMFSSKSPAKPATQNASASAPSEVTAVATKTSDVVVIVTGTAGKSWVGVQDSSGAQVFSGAIRVGEAKTFTDSQNLSVTVGNAGAVNLNVNGKDLGTPGQVGEVVHLTFDQNSSSQG